MVEYFHNLFRQNSKSLMWETRTKTRALTYLQAHKQTATALSSHKHIPSIFSQSSK